MIKSKVKRLRPEVIKPLTFTSLDLYLHDNRFPDKRIIRTKTGTQCESETLPDAVSLYKTYRQSKWPSKSPCLGGLPFANRLSSYARESGKRVQTRHWIIIWEDEPAWGRVRRPACYLCQTDVCGTTDTQNLLFYEQVRQNVSQLSWAYVPSSQWVQRGQFPHEGSYDG